MLEWYLQTGRVPGLDATLWETESNRVETRFLNSAASWSGPAQCQTHPVPRAVTRVADVAACARRSGAGVRALSQR